MKQKYLKYFFLLLLGVTTVYMWEPFKTGYLNYTGYCFEKSRRLTQAELKEILLKNAARYSLPGKWIKTENGSTKYVSFGDKFKILSDKEYYSILLDMLQKDELSTRRGHHNGAEQKILPYKSKEAFFKKNKNCCLISDERIGWKTPTPDNPLYDKKYSDGVYDPGILRRILQGDGVYYYVFDRWRFYFDQDNKIVEYLERTEGKLSACGEISEPKDWLLPH